MLLFTNLISVEIERPRKGDEDGYSCERFLPSWLVEIERPRKGDEDYLMIVTVISLSVEIERPRKGDED